MEGKRILVVEDEKIVAMDIARKLEKLGYNVIAMVSSGRDALEKAQTDRPDLILMDIVLEGEMDGIQTAAQIQSTFDIPVVYLTAYADEKTLEKVKGTGSFGYVLKPFDTNDLRIAVELALYKHRNAGELLRAQKLESLGILAGSIAHDFNNLLAAISGFIDFAQTQLKSEDEVCQSLEKAKRACVQASELTKQLITFSKGGKPLRKVIPQQEDIREKSTAGEMPVDKGKILVMDDEELIRDIMKRILNKLGYEVEVAKDGDEAIALYKKAEESAQRFSMVILDLTVRWGMGGKLAIRKLLQINPYVKAVIASGYTNDDILTNYRKYGFKGAITKPFTIKELKSVLNDVLSTNKQDASHSLLEINLP